MCNQRICVFPKIFREYAYSLITHIPCYIYNIFVFGESGGGEYKEKYFPTYVSHIQGRYGTLGD